MLPLRLVLDTNIIVSAALKPDGLQRTVFLLAITKPARLYVSAPVFSEYQDVLSRPELKIRKGLRLQFLQLIENRSYRVSPTRLLQLTGDPNDNIFLECADTARADYLVTGNARNFPSFWKKTKVITSREFIDVVGAASHRLNNKRRKGVVTTCIALQLRLFGSQRLYGIDSRGAQRGHERGENSHHRQKNRDSSEREWIER